MKEKIIIATIKSWNINNALKFKKRHSKNFNILLITKKRDLKYKSIKKFNPRYILFLHWSWIIPRKIYDNFECAAFHMTDLPFGRGGSPLQNLIDRGIYKTKLTAFKVIKELDAGPIYLKRNLSLKGTAVEIFRRASKIIFEDMIPFIVDNQPVPFPQRERVIKFKRRLPAQSNIAALSTPRVVYDYIRMLDAQGYPQAYIGTSKLKIEFSGAKRKKNCVMATAKIKVKR